MKEFNQVADRAIDRRQRIQQVGQLRREKMLAARGGARRVLDEHRFDLNKAGNKK